MLKRILNLFKMKEELKTYKEIIRRYRLLLKRIADEAKKAKQMNCSIAYSEFNKIVDLANSDISKDYDNRYNSFLLDEEEDIIDDGEELAKLEIIPNENTLTI